jgi:hypothetical protein
VNTCEQVDRLLPLEPEIIVSDMPHMIRSMVEPPTIPVQIWWGMPAQRADNSHRDPALAAVVATEGG